MKVFISWSGETSKALAEILRGWLPSVIQATKPYFTPDDITKGSRWNTEIAKELEECKIGLICLTADNVEAPWVMFEAGALSRSLSTARVCPLLFGLEPSDVKGPLVQFQAAPFGRDDMKKVVRMMNQELGAAALTSDVFDSVFDMWWPKLEERVKKVMSGIEEAPKKSTRSERDILDEILGRVRAGAPTIIPGTSISPAAVDDLICCYRDLKGIVRESGPLIHPQILEVIERLAKPVDYIATCLGRDDDSRGPIRERLDTRPTALATDEEILRAQLQGEKAERNSLQRRR